MSYFRVQYDGYLEDQYPNREAAIIAFLDHLENDIDSRMLTVEEWDEEEKEWRTE